MGTGMGHVVADPAAERGIGSFSYSSLLIFHFAKEFLTEHQAKK
jgi:hypothetical protein